MGTLRGQVDLMGECNPGSKVNIDEFVAVVCTQGCVNNRCFRSGYTDNATQAKIKRHEHLLEFVDPEAEQPLSPLSNYPDEIVHRADPDTVVEPSVKVDAAVDDLDKAQKAAQRPKDPWSAPTAATMHKEWETSEQDPWSVDFSGAIDAKVGKNATIRIPGKKRK